MYSKNFYITSIVVFSCIFLLTTLPFVFAQTAPTITFLNAMTSANTEDVVPDVPNFAGSYFDSHGMHIRITLPDPCQSSNTPCVIQVDIKSITPNGVRDELNNLPFEANIGQSYYELPTTYVYLDEHDEDEPSLLTQAGDDIKVSYGATSALVKVIEDIDNIITNTNQPQHIKPPSCPDADSDGSPDIDPDGLCRFWKQDDGLRITHNGATFFWSCNNNDPLNRCPQQFGRDVYLEIDYFVGHEPDVTALQSVVEAFANQGITLHIDLENQNEQIPFHKKIISPPSGGGTSNTEFDDLKEKYFGTYSERSDSNARDILTARQMAVHYAIFGHSLNDDGSGLAEQGGNDFVVTLGNWAGGVGSPDDQAGTLMHELGHNLMLFHGGNDSVNCKPNYPSVMSYSRQFSSLFAGTLRPIDYSSEVLTSSPFSNSVTHLMKSDLNEIIGIPSIQYNFPVPFVYSDMNGNVRTDYTGYWTGPPIIAWLAFENDIMDSSGQANHGIMPATTSFVSITERPGMAYDFQTGDPVKLTNEQKFDFEYNKPFSISFWLKKPSNTSTETIIAKGTFVAGSWDVFSGGGADYLQFNLRGTNVGENLRVRNGEDIGDNAWHHWVITYDGLHSANSVTIYKDGQPTPIVTLENDLNSSILNNIEVTVGALSNDGAQLTGQVDDVRIWDYKLEQSDITKLQNTEHVTGFQVIRPIGWDDPTVLQTSTNVDVNNIPNIQRNECEGGTPDSLDGYNDWISLKMDMWQDKVKAMDD